MVGPTGICMETGCCVQRCKHFDPPRDVNLLCDDYGDYRCVPTVDDWCAAPRQFRQEAGGGGSQEGGSDGGGDREQRDARDRQCSVQESLQCGIRESSRGQWRWLGGDRFVIEWNNGEFVDNLTLSSGRSKLTGTNQFGVAVTADRILSPGR